MTNPIDDMRKEQQKLIDAGLNPNKKYIYVPIEYIRETLLTSGIAKDEQDADDRIARWRAGGELVD